MLSKKTQKEVEHWESKTNVFVFFDKDFSNVHLEGIFYPDELSDIARIQRKADKEMVIKPDAPKTLFD
jgi:hypothetical protein